MPTSLSTSSDLVHDASRDEVDGTTVLSARIEGEINLHNSPALRADLLRLADSEQPGKVVLDLAGVPYMDSSAIAVLVEMLKAVRANDGSVHLANLQPRVRGLLQIARLETIFVMDKHDPDED